MKSYDLLFDEEFHNSQNIDEKFAELCNKKGLKAGLKYLKEIGATWYDKENYEILYTISAFTKKDTDEKFFQSLIERIRRQNGTKEVKIEKLKDKNVSQLIINKEDISVTVIPLSKRLPVSLETCPDLEDDTREGTCFAKALTIATHLGRDNTIVTGYCYGYSDKSRFLHSFVETILNGEEVVIDGTLNAIMNKDGYYALRHIKPLTKISNQTLREDMEKYLYKIKKFPPEVYFVFRDEIIRDFEKNDELFDIKR